MSRPMSRLTPLLSNALIVICLAHAHKVLAATGHPDPAPQRSARLIALGWDMPDSDQFPALVSHIEQQPFDGLVVRLLGQGETGQALPLGWAFKNERWQQAWFEPGVQRLRQSKFKRLKDNFLLLNANPGDVDWFDDAGWANIVEHWRIAAWAAREAHFKGILFDPEPYAQPHAQFDFAAQAQAQRHTFAQYCQKARQRGAEVMRALNAEYPGITLLTLFMNSVNTAAVDARKPRALRRCAYGLYPAFIDGWLDAADAQTRFVDGCEAAYRYNSRREFLEAAALIRGHCQQLVAPENRAKYRAQVQTGFGLYLDAYVNPKDSAWYLDGLGTSRVERLATNVTEALSLADEYVWVYGEKFRWWPTADERVQPKSWDEALPGCAAALAFARDPASYAKSKVQALARAGTLRNLVRNPSFAGPRASCPAEWICWQQVGSSGIFSCDPDAGTSAPGPGAARAGGVADGCLFQAHPVQPGQRYAFGASRRVSGTGEGSVAVRWQDVQGNWVAENHELTLSSEALETSASEEWHALLGALQVPDGAGLLILMLRVSGQAQAADAIYFDDVTLYRID